MERYSGGGGMMKVVRFEIESYNKRAEMCVALAEAGYPVWVEETKEYMPTRYYVCVEIRECDLQEKG